MKYRVFIKTIKKNGWILVRKSDAVHTYKKEGNPNIVSIHIHTLGAEIPKGLLHRYESITGLELDS